MIELINQLIAINLELFYTTKQQQLQLKDFIDSQGKQISGAKLLADIMQHKELIRSCPEKKGLYQLTEFGYNVCLFGGWEKHLENESKLQAVIDEHTVPIVSKASKEIPTIILSVVAIVVIILTICRL